LLIAKETPRLEFKEGTPTNIILHYTNCKIYGITNYSSDEGETSHFLLDHWASVMFVFISLLVALHFTGRPDAVF